jgi:hypothetical protein
LSATLLSAAVTCLVSLVLGQSALRLAGAREWSWLAAPVGISVAMVIAAPALAVPGRSTTMAVLLAALTAAGLVWCGRDPAHRPPLSGLLAGLPVLLLVLIPFLAVHRAGVLGVSFNNDMGTHMWIVEGFLSQAVVDVTPLHSDYPYGPHAMVAALAGGLGVGVDRAFAGWTMALPILTAWTALALVPRAAWWRQAAVATVVGAPFLVASYYAQGAFKEVLQACLVLGTAILFAGFGPRLGLGRWVPLGLILAGSVSVYSVTGLLWPLTFGALWLTVTVALRVRSRGGSGLGAAARNEAPALGIGLAVLVVSLLPQAGRIVEFVSKNSSGPLTIPEDALGNLFGPLPVWEAFGVWANPDFRTPAPSGVEGWVWTAFVVALVIAGAVWLLRRRRWMLPLAAAGSMAIWAVSELSQSPYVAAKALVIASPLLLAVAVVPLVERLPQRLPRSMRGLPGRSPGAPPAWWLALFLIALLVFRVGVSDVRALRTIPLGPTDHAEELRDLRPTVEGRRTLFLGNDDFIRWELAGAPALAPVLGVQELPIRAQKAWSEGEPHDFDSVPPAVLDEYRWIITTRDAAGSSPPPGLRLVRTTPSFALWRRVGPIGRRSILAEGEMAGAMLDCDSSVGRTVLRGGGVAAVAPRPVTAAGGSLVPGGTLAVPIDLAPGSWRLQLAYFSRLPVEATGPGLRATLPPSLDRPGPRWPLGRIEVRGDEPTVLTFGVGDPFFAPDIAVAELATIVATWEAPRRVIPVRRACDRYVDWYRPSVPHGPGG